MMTKTCTICGKEKNLRDFVGKSGGGWKYKHVCYACSSREETALTKAKRTAKYLKYGKSDKWRGLKRWLKYKYNLSIRVYAELYGKQGGKCAICNSVPENGKHLYVDHDHKSKKIRGLLCQQCNSALGFAQDNPLLLGKMVEYLISHKT